MTIFSVVHMHLRYTEADGASVSKTTTPMTAFFFFSSEWYSLKIQEMSKEFP